jgi:hypothetical protein
VKALGHYNLGYVWTISAVAALGGLLFGYDWVVIGGAKPLLREILSPWVRRIDRMGEQLRADRMPRRIRRLWSDER